MSVCVCYHIHVFFIDEVNPGKTTRELPTEKRTHVSLCTTPSEDVEIGREGKCGLEPTAIFFNEVEVHCTHKTFVLVHHVSLQARLLSLSLSPLTLSLSLSSHTNSQGAC